MPRPTLSSTGTNLAVLIGSLSRLPELRTLPSGDLLLAIDVTVRSAGGRAESVPVAWIGAPPTAAGWAIGDDVLVVGRVRRRFFRAGGATQSRTEVVAATVVPLRRPATARKALQGAVDSLAAVADR